MITRMFSQHPFSSGEIVGEIRPGQLFLFVFTGAPVSGSLLAECMPQGWYFVENPSDWVLMLVHFSEELLVFMSPSGPVRIEAGRLQTGSKISMVPV
jgi:hypothetical protein